MAMALVVQGCTVQRAQLSQTQNWQSCLHADTNPRSSAQHIGEANANQHMLVGWCMWFSPRKTPPPNRWTELSR